MKARTIAQRVMVVLVAAIVIAMSATLAWAVASDYQVRGYVPKGVTVAGRDLSGMTEGQARQAIEETVSSPMLRELAVTGDHKKWTLDSADFVSVDVDAMLNEAYTTRRSAPLIARLSSDLLDTPLTNDVKPVYSVDTTAVATWVANAAKVIDRQPVDSSRTIEGYAFKITPSKKGVRLDRKTSAAMIVSALSAEQALSSADRSVALKVNPRKPRVTESAFKDGIIVSLNRCRIYLYNGDELVKSYSCAPGRPGFPTPTGDFKIVSKQRYAPWINPGSDWAKSMPAVIPGGPGNPMGTTKIGISYPGVFMHGVPPGEYSSIGTHASHGCMRMMPSQVLDLYGRVSIGDPVYIRD